MRKGNTKEPPKPKAKPKPDLRPDARKLIARISAVMVNGPRYIDQATQERMLGAEHALKTLLGQDGAYLVPVAGQRV